MVTEKFFVDIGEDAKQHIILKNIVRMLSRRKYFADDGTGTYMLDVDENAKNIENLTDNGLYTLITTTNKKIHIKLLLQSVSSINKIPVITEFLNANKNDHKIIVFKDIKKKGISQIMSNPSVEIFMT